MNLAIGHRLFDGTVYAGISPISGHPMFAAPQDSTGKFSFLHALQHAEKRNFLGYKDWRVPSVDEMEILYEHRDAIGGFQTARYRCAYPYYLNLTWAHNFNTGHLEMQKPQNYLYLRCIRGIDL